MHRNSLQAWGVMEERVLGLAAGHALLSDASADSAFAFDPHGVTRVGVLAWSMLLKGRDQGGTASAGGQPTVQLAKRSPCGS
jgi:hypothetical protein